MADIEEKDVQPTPPESLPDFKTGALGENVLKESQPIKLKQEQNFTGIVTPISASKNPTNKGEK